MVITIDGPAGVGKTTTAKKLAKKLGYQYLDTGAMYRAVTYFFAQSSININAQDHVKKMLDILKLELDFTSNDSIIVLLDGEDISSLIRSEQITNTVSRVSALEAVREKIVEMQKETVRNGNFVVEGRDIGTVVFPDAKHKFFLVADYDIRAERRLKDFKRVNEELNVNKIKQDLTDRDQYDSSRKLSPLKQAKDAIVVDTSNCTIDDQVNQIYKHIERN